MTTQVTSFLDGSSSFLDTDIDIEDLFNVQYDKHQT